MSTKERLPADYMWELESPFLDEELFVGESEEEWEPRAAALAAESPFVDALEERRSRIDEALLEEEEKKCESGYGIIGDIDNRDPLSKKQTLRPAYRWICQISVRQRRNGEMLALKPTGTGVLISPRHVLTAAHLLRNSYKDDRGQWAKDDEAAYIVVTPARNGDQRPFDKYEADSWETSPKYDPRDKDSWKYDYGIIRLKEAIGSKTFRALKNRQLCYWGSSACGRNTFLELVEAKRLEGQTGFTAGYPKDKEGGVTMWFAKGTLSGLDIKGRREVMSVEADACYGQSGSPVWINEKGKRYLVGVLTNIGTGVTNSAVRINQEVIDQISKWLEAATEELDAQESLERIDDSEVEEALDEERERPADASFSEYEAVPLDVREAFDEQVESPSGKTSILLTNLSKGIADAVRNKEWPLALKVAIEEGWRDHNKLTSLLFYARHPELEGRLLDPDDPQDRGLRREWINIRDDEVWPAIQRAAKNADLVVSGNDVTQWDQKFWDKSGKEFKSLVEWAAKEVDINPGLLAATLLAEESERKIYLTKARVSSYHVGVDDFYERRGKLKEKVPAYTKVGWNKKQKPEVHLNDAKNNRREVKTIRFDSGRDGLLASAVYLKYGEIVLREEATRLGKDFDALPVETRLALIRIAFAGGPGAAKTFLGKVLEEEDILVREDIPLKKYQTQRNATIRAAQAMHLSEWVFGVPTKVTIEPEVETSEAFDENERSYEPDAELELEDLDAFAHEEQSFGKAYREYGEAVPEVEMEESFDEELETEESEEWREFEDGSPQDPITVAELANSLTNLVFWARNPKLKGKKLGNKQKKEAVQWTEILQSEIRPAFHHFSTEFKVAQLIFFARHPEVEGSFKELPKEDQEKFNKEFSEIREQEVRPWLKPRIARGKLNSRTIFVVNHGVFKRLPVRVHNQAGAEVADQFAFVGRKQSKAPITVMFLEPDRFPESYNFSDAVVSLINSDATAHVNLAIRQQKSNAVSAIRRLGINATFEESRTAGVADRLGHAEAGKQVVTAGKRNLAIPLMAAAVDCREVISAVEEETGEKLPKQLHKFSEQQQALLGTSLGRAIAHEARHIYQDPPPPQDPPLPYDPHADAGLGSDEPTLTGTTSRATFSAPDQTDILKSIQKLEKKQGSATMVDTFAETDREKGFPF